MKTDVSPDGCTSVRKYLNDRSLCPRWRLCSGCERVRARRNQWKIAKSLQYDIELAQEQEAPIKIGVLTSTLPGKSSKILLMQTQVFRLLFPFVLQFHL